MAVPTGNEWIGAIQSATQKVMPKLIDSTMRSRLWLRMTEQMGKLTLNYLGSWETIFDVDWKEPPVTQFGDGGEVTYTRRDYLKQGTIDWRGYQTNDFMTLKEYEMLYPQGQHTIVNRYKRVIPKLTKAMRNQVAKEFYIDGYASGNDNRFCGIESMMGDDGNTVVADIIANPDDTYFGIDTDLGQGGSWSSDLTTKPNATHGYDWPEGSGTTEWDFWSPFLINYTSTNWPSGSDNTWYDTCVYVLRRALQWMSLVAASEEDGFKPLCMMTGSMMTDFKNHHQNQFRVSAPVDQESMEFGFPDTISFEGLKLKSEFGVPATTGYIINMAAMELAILGKKLVSTRGPEWSSDRPGWKWLAWNFGNYLMKPKGMVKLYPYASS